VLSRLSGRRESSIFFLHQRQNNEQRYVPPPKQTITPTPLEVEAAPPLEPIIPVAATPSVTELHHVANSGGSAAQASRAWALVVGPQTLYTPCIFFQLFSPISKAHMSKDWALGLTHQSPISVPRTPRTGTSMGGGTLMPPYSREYPTFFYTSRMYMLHTCVYLFNRKILSNSYLHDVKTI
jgi:hypothetical protein